jgi:hypothetical protein
VVDGLDVGDTTGCPAVVVGVRLGVEQMRAEKASDIAAAARCRVGRAAASRCWCGRPMSGGADTRACLARGRGRNLVGAARSWEVPVALSGVTDQTGAERDDPGEAGGHAVAVGVAGDEVISEQSGYRFVEVTGV